MLHACDVYTRCALKYFNVSFWTHPLYQRCAKTLNETYYDAKFCFTIPATVEISI